MISGAQWVQVGMWRCVRAQRAARSDARCAPGDTGERPWRGRARRKVEKPLGEPEASSCRGEETLQIFGETARSLAGLSGVSSGDVALCRCP